MGTTLDNMLVEGFCRAVDLLARADALIGLECAEEIDTTTILPGEALVSTLGPIVVHYGQPGQVDRTRCNRRVRYHLWPEQAARIGRVCYDCQTAATAHPRGED